ncbi:MAG TPA: SMC-Scp complex subunit ScpB [Actinobacteria bacterium]|nr:SMC-Scp complex subunit ScpB [Actinomycetota bacterium]
MIEKNEKDNRIVNAGIELNLFGPGWIKTYIEGILFISEDPVRPVVISETLGIEEKKVKKVIDVLEKEYIEQNRGFVLKKISGGYRLYSNPILNEVLQRFVKTNIRTRLSQAALETLAITAYKQPITRTQIAEIRGVRTDSVVLTLVDKGLLKESGKLKEPGSPILYRTADRFLELLGLNSLKDLPPIKEFKEDEESKQD